MTYTDKVKSSRVMKDIINDMKDEESIKFTYGKGWKGEPNVYTIKCYRDTDDDRTSYSIWTNFSGMNVDEITPTQVKCYTYDMMSQRTTYNFPLNKMIMVNSDIQ